jgi:hypothetical protein
VIRGEFLRTEAGDLRRARRGEVMIELSISTNKLTRSLRCVKDSERCSLRLDF